MNHARLISLAIGILQWGAHALCFGATSELKQPIALAWLEETQTLWAATKNDQSILRVHVDSKAWERVFQVESPLTDLHRIPGTSTLAALQSSPGRIYLFDAARQEAPVDIASFSIPSYAENIVSSPDGRCLYVLHRWNHLATILEQTNEPSPEGIPDYRVRQCIQLPFAPGSQLLVSDSDTWIITAAFGGGMALLNPQTGILQSTLERSIHNIRDMVLDREHHNIWMAHQTLHPNATTLRGDIQWGFLMENKVSGFSVKNLTTDYSSSEPLQPKGQLERPGNAAGDPEALLWTDQDEMVIALAGVGEVAVMRPDTTQVYRSGVGRRPSALAYDKTGRRVFVANTLSDSISILKLDPAPQLSSTIRLGRLKELSELAQGERLFFDAHQSFHGWFSCHSCHTDGHANGMLNDNEADGGFGAPKKVLSLLGVADTAPWSWLGKRNDLVEQAHRSIQTTMREIPTQEKAKALSAYMKTLPPAPPLKPDLPPRRINQGMELFERLRCDECHLPPTYTDEDVYDVGIPDASGSVAFNPPSLLGVSQRTHFLHDGRIKDLKDVFTKQKHMLEKDLSPQELALLLDFLQSL